MSVFREIISLPADHPDLASIISVNSLEQNPHPLAIGHIIAAGAYYNDDDAIRHGYGGGFSVRDREWLHHAITLCNDIGLPIDRQFKLTPLNLMYGNGQNFFKIKLDADLLVACHVIDPTKDKGALATLKSGDGYLTCNLHNDQNPYPWGRAARRAGIKIIVNYWNDPDLEIGAEQFETAGYVLISRSCVEASMYSWGQDRLRQNYTRDCFVSEKYAETVLRTNPNSKLAKRILDLDRR
jgi:hypothetical protein